ncbi:MAG: hypothetical protein EZS28_024361 [Streblomastix strix]|uniref:Uncharacterized protein n=1 Tax=Streblomastix strix TaxID=222440 RepID=A0A5J4VCC0_9EUKA|nr:MAG: hypothetical protein EZS28_024361 [Streblomastix strix]
METTLETNNEFKSEYVDSLAGQKRSVGRPKKYFNDDDRKEAIRMRQLATKRRYTQKKAQICIEIANLFLIASAFDVINEFVKDKMTQITSPIQISIPTIIDEDSPFEKNQQTSIDSPSQYTRRRSSIFENELTADSSVCKWLLDIISEDEHMLKESAHFILSVPQLIRVVAYTFDVNEQQIQLNEDVSTCCTRFMNVGSITLTDIRIGNVNIHALDENKVNLLRDTYKLCLQKVRKITSILDLSEISSKVMEAVSQGLLAVLNKI